MNDRLTMAGFLIRAFPILVVWGVVLSALFLLAMTDILTLMRVLLGVGLLVASINVSVRLSLLIALIPLAHAGIGLESLPGFGVYDLYVFFFILLFLLRLVLEDLFVLEVPFALKLTIVMFIGFVPSLLNTPSMTASLKSFAQLAASILTALGLYYYLIQEKNRRMTVPLLRFYCLVAVIASAIGLYQAATADSLAQVASGRVFLRLFGEVNYYAGYLLTSVPLLIAFFFVERNRVLRVLFIAGLVVTVLGLISTISRSAFLTLGILLLMYMAYFLVKGSGSRRVVGIAMLTVSLGAVFLLMVTDIGKAVIDLVALSDRVQMVLEGRDRSLGQRQAIIEVVLRVVQAHPFIGVGYGSFEEVFDWYKEGVLSTGFGRSVHNTGLRILAETGIAGFLPAIAFVVALLLSVWKTMRQTMTPDQHLFAFSVLMSLVSFLVMSMTLDQMFEPHFWVMVGFALAMGKNTRMGRTLIDTP